MGIIKRGILGGFSNKVGNVVGSSWKGIATMRVLPLSVANPRTAAQVAVRTAFSKITALASAGLTGFVKPLNDRFAVRMSGYNRFIQMNTNAFDASGEFVPANLLISQGRLGETEIVSAEANDQFGIDIIWSPTPSGALQLSTDLAYAVVISANGELLGVSSGEVTRNSGVVSVPIPDVDELPTIYLAFLRADGTEVSTSTGKKLTNPQP